MFKRDVFIFLVSFLFLFVTYIPFIAMFGFFVGTPVAIAKAIAVAWFMEKWVETLKRLSANSN